VADFVMKIFGLIENDFYPSLVQTNWNWLPLNKRGNSNQRERIALMKRFIGQFGQNHIK